MKKILIVDDQPEVKELLKMVLKADDRQFWLAERGDDAIEIAREVLPDVILLDVMMPGGLNGYEVTRILKSAPPTNACSIVVMTAKVQEQDQVDAFAAGADDYIGKPYNLEDLKTKVATFLEQG